MKSNNRFFALILAVLMTASMAVPTLAAGYAKDPGYKDVETEKIGEENANSIAVDVGIVAAEDSEEEITELSADYEGTNDSNMIVAAPDAINPGAFRKLAQSGLDYAVEIKAPESEDVIARYVVKADEAAKMRKTVRLTSKVLSDEVLTEVQRQLGDAYIASAFYSTQLFGNVLVNAFVNVQIKPGDALEAMLAEGKKPVVYKVNENTGKLTRYAIDATYEDGFICFDIQKGDSYVVSAEDAIGEYKVEVITEDETEEEETEEVTEAVPEETIPEEIIPDEIDTDGIDTDGTDTDETDTDETDTDETDTDETTADETAANETAPDVNPLNVITPDGIADVIDGNVANGSVGAAYYENGYIYVPIDLAIKYNTHTVKNDKNTWYVRYSIGIVINHPFDMKEITVECKNNVVAIPEKNCNEHYFLKTRCNNVATIILATQKGEEVYSPEFPEPIIIRQ